MLVSKIKKVGFNFFRPIIKMKDDETKLFNFKDIFEKIRGEYSQAKEINDLETENHKLVYNYNGEPARLSSIEVDVDTEYYHLVFERLNYQVPTRTTLHGESQALDLDDDEYIGFEVNVLYDPYHQIFMIQRNRDSLGPSGIEIFLRTIIDRYVGQIDGIFNLAIVSDTSAKKRAFNQSAYRKIHIKVTGNKADGIVEKFTKGGNKGVDSVEIIFNSKIEKAEKIDEDFAKKILDEYIDDPEVQKLRIRSRENEDDVVEPIDLIDHKLQTFCEFDYRENRHLNPISVFEKMKLKFDIEDGGFKNKVLRES